MSTYHPVDNYSFKMNHAQDKQIAFCYNYAVNKAMALFFFSISLLKVIALLFFALFNQQPFFSTMFFSLIIN